MAWPRASAALVCSAPYPTDECPGAFDTCYPVCPCHTEADYYCMDPSLANPPVPTCCVQECSACNPPSAECECRADRTWVRIPHDESNAPPNGGAVAYNPDLGRVLLFGGRTPGDWFAFDPHARRWESMGFSVELPEPPEPPEACTCQTGLIWKAASDAGLPESEQRGCGELVAVSELGAPGQDIATVEVPRGTIVRNHVAECVETCGCEDGLYAALTQPEICWPCDNPCEPECVPPSCEEMALEWAPFWTGEVQDPDAAVLPVGATDPDGPTGFEARCRNLSDLPDYTAGVEDMAIAYDPETRQMAVVGGCRTRSDDDELPSFRDCTGAIRWFDPETGGWSADDGRGDVDWFGGQEFEPGTDVRYWYAGFDKTGSRLVTRALTRSRGFAPSSDPRHGHLLREFAMDEPSPNAGATLSVDGAAYGLDPARNLVVGLSSSNDCDDLERRFQPIDEGARYVFEPFPVDASIQHLIFDETRSLFLMFGGSFSYCMHENEYRPCPAQSTTWEIEVSDVAPDDPIFDGEGNLEGEGETSDGPVVRFQYRDVSPCGPVGSDARGPNSDDGTAAYDPTTGTLVFVTADSTWLYGDADLLVPPDSGASSGGSAAEPLFDQDDPDSSTAACLCSAPASRNQAQAWLASLALLALALARRAKTSPSRRLN